MTEVKSPTSFRLERNRLELTFRRATLVSRTWETPTFVRVRVEGEDLQGFTSPGSDDHMRLFFPDGAPTEVEELRAAPNRELTPREWDGEAGWLDVEFTVHGDEGVAGPWAATAPIGSVIGVGGPRGAMSIVGRPDAWFLAGDETAVPAIRRFAALMDADAVGQIFVEVVGAEHELPIEAPAGVTVTQVHRGDAFPGTALAARLDALGEADRPAGDVFGFVAAEQRIVKNGRALLLDRWALSAEQVVVKGYWKSGEAEYHAPH